MPGMLDKKRPGGVCMPVIYTRKEWYHDLIEEAHKRIRVIKNSSYYKVFGSETERKQDIRKKLELIEWLTKRKQNA